jgi:hypothetical protein
MLQIKLHSAKEHRQYIPSTKATNIPSDQKDVITLIFNSRTAQRFFIERLNRPALTLRAL